MSTKKRREEERSEKAFDAFLAGAGISRDELEGDEASDDPAFDALMSGVPKDALPDDGRKDDER